MAESTFVTYIHSIIRLSCRFTVYYYIKLQFCSVYSSGYKCYRGAAKSVVLKLWYMYHKLINATIVV